MTSNGFIVGWLIAYSINTSNALYNGRKHSMLHIMNLVGVYQRLSLRECSILERGRKMLAIKRRHRHSNIVASSNLREWIAMYEACHIRVWSPSKWAPLYDSRWARDDKLQPWIPRILLHYYGGANTHRFVWYTRELHGMAWGRHLIRFLIWGVTKAHQCYTTNVTRLKSNGLMDEHGRITDSRIQEQTRWMTPPFPPFWARRMR